MTFFPAETRCGIFLLKAENGLLCDVFFPGFYRPELLQTGGTVPPEDREVLSAAARELAEYLEGKRRSFDLPLLPAPTPFAETVRQAMLAIPFGETRTYGDLAAWAGKPSACRAVGNACHRNRIPVIVPCHRVTACGGKPGGFAPGPDWKRLLLSIEGVALP